MALATNVGYCCNNAFSQLPIRGLQIHTSHLLSHQWEYFVKTLQRARAAAAAIGRRLLLLSVAADRCTFANRPLVLTSELAQEADAVHTLSATASLPGILVLYTGVELCLETKVCSELGVVRGCPALVEDILLPENEPFLFLNLLYRFLLCFAFLLFSIHKHVLFFAVYPFLPICFH